MQQMNNVYVFTHSHTIEAFIIPSMRNIDFSLGFTIDREKLNKYMISQPALYCLLETSFGYTGVNIKIPIVDNICNMKIKYMTYSNKWSSTDTTYQQYIDTLPHKDKQDKLTNKRYNTFLVFHSGKVIMSGLTYEFMKDTYSTFLNIINDAYDEIEERLLI
jgi:hypothetical protein